MRVTNLLEWKAQVLKRDNYTCQQCGSHSKLQAHHKKSSKYFPGLLLEVNNGETLCKTCHQLVPKTLGLFASEKPGPWYPDGWFYRKAGIRPNIAHISKSDRIALRNLVNKIKGGEPSDDTATKPATQPETQPV
jgi:ribosomal protein S27AE